MSKKPDDPMAEYKIRDARIVKNAANAIACMKRDISKKEEPDLARVLALVLESFAYDGEDEKSSPIPVWIDFALEEFCGRRCMDLIPVFLKLHERLMKEAGKVVEMKDEKKALLAENSYERTALPLLDFKGFSKENPATIKLFKDRGWKHTPSVLLRKALVLTEQSRHYVVVLEQEYGKWSIHVREWFVSDDDDEETQKLIKILRKTNNKVQQLDIVTRLVDRRSKMRTDRKGVYYPERLGIRAYIKSNFVSGYVDHKDDACSGLLCEDYRDTGYVLSFSERHDEDKPECKDAWACLSKIRCFFAYAFNHHETMKID